MDQCPQYLSNNLAYTLLNVIALPDGFYASSQVQHVITPFCSFLTTCGMMIGKSSALFTGVTQVCKRALILGKYTAEREVTCELLYLTIVAQCYTHDHRNTDVISRNFLQK